MRWRTATNPLVEGSGVRRAVRTAVLTVAGVAGLALAVGALMASGAAPAWLRTLLGEEPGVGAAVALACFLLWLGAGPMWVAQRLPLGPGWALGLPLWAFLAALPLYALLWLFAGEWMAEGLRWGWLSSGEVLLVLTSGVLVLMLAGGAASAACVMPWQSASRCVGSLALVGAPWLVVAWLALPREAWSGPADTLFRAEPVPGELLVGLVLVLVGASAAVLGHAVWHSRRRLPGAMLAAAVLVLPGWFLMTAAFSSKGSGVEEAADPFRALVAAGATAEMSAGGLLARWALLQAAITAILAYGQVVALAADVRPALLGEPARRAPPPQTAAPPREPSPPAALKPADPRRVARIYAVLAVVGIALAIYGSLVPLQVRPVPLSEAVDTVLNLRYLDLGIRRRADLVANLLVFVPLGFFAMGALTRAGRLAGRWLVGIGVALGLAGLAFGIEFTQVWFAPRTVSLNDVLAECAGAVLGVGAWLLVGGRVTRWVVALRRERDTRRLAVLVLGGYTAALVAFQLFPFDLVLSGEELAQDLRGPKLRLVPLSDVANGRGAATAASVAAFLPVGYLAAVRWARRRGHLVLGLVGGLGLGICVEALQVLVHSRTTSTTDVLLGASGAGVGGWLAVRFGPAAVRPYPRGGAWRVLSYALRLGLAVGLVGLILGLKWEPSEFRWPEEGLAGAIAGIVHIPFYHQYYSTEFEATVQLLADVGGAVGLGMVVASLLDWGGRAGRFAAGMVAGLLAMVPEAGQMFFPQHAADLTTIVMAAAGGMLGVWLYGPFVRIFVRPRSSEPPAAPPDAWAETST